MKRFEIMITKRHWVEIDAESEDEALDLAEEQIPSFSSSFEETDMDIVSVTN